ncbi:hypothetical protein AB8B22_06415 [Leptotrichia sp. HSP-334]|uniref:Uncharacterized protein n=1 Tax=Leptotrichia rugosa TaxID=3239302 RepID=A0AB39VF88_9FUSO
MKKLIFGAFLLFSVIGFSRYVERCSITSEDSCVSLESGKKFTFRGYPFEGFRYGAVYRVYFEGQGNRKLYYTTSTYLY